jgi:hypothetical protein
MKIVPLALFFTLAAISLTIAQPDPPELASWLRNTTGLTGYNNLPANVQLVRYSANSVYVSSSDIPGYSIGPWPGDPNIPANQNFVFKIPRNPSVNNGTKTPTPLGTIAAWVNGVATFNALDAMSYQNQNIWHQNAVLVEASSFDACLGHPAPGGVYHHHQNPRCLYAADSSQHSPLLGYAFDGYPMYGPYGFANADGSGGIKRMESGYRLRSITQRTTLPDGTVLSPSQYGPNVSGGFPLGYYVEDFEYVEGLGTLDRYNGRWTVTPEYPDSIYAYFVTIDSSGNSAYPYAIGPGYYGVVEMANITSHGHVAVTESVMTYNPVTAVRVGGSGVLPSRIGLYQNYPNPFNPSTTIRYELARGGEVSLRVYDLFGREVVILVDGVKPAGTYEVNFDAGAWPGGVYFYRLQAGRSGLVKKLVLLK